MDRKLNLASAFGYVVFLLVAATLAGCHGQSPGNLPAPTILGKSAETWEGIHIYRDFAYGPRPDAPGEGEGYESSITGHDPGGRIYHSHRSGQFFDFIFDATREIRPDAPVYVNVHGGGWCSPADKDGESMWFLRRLAKRGFLVVNMNYQMQPNIFDERVKMERRENATFLDMIRDIDTLATYLKRDFLPRVGVEPKKFAIGGGSAGAYLSLLYAYDQDNPAVLEAKLRHEYRVGFAVDVVGPVDLTSPGMLAMAVGGKVPKGGMLSKSLIDRFATLVCWLVDDDVKGRVARGDLEGAKSILRKFSPTWLATPSSVPTILAYCRLHPFSDTDGMVPVDCYEGLMRRLDELGVPHVGEIRSWRVHGWLRDGYEDWLADQAQAFAQRHLR